MRRLSALDELEATRLIRLILILDCTGAAELSDRQKACVLLGCAISPFQRSAPVPSRDAFIDWAGRAWDAFHGQKES